jgi:predicted DNA-binding transcriptional regulator YafY
MPASLREQVGALTEVTVGVTRRDRRDNRPDVDVLTALALACRRSERVRFDYATGDGVESTRHAEPYRLVSLGQRFYLVANDLDRDDWRTYRVDRVSRVRPTGARFVVDDPPDAAALVARGVAVRAYEQQWTVRFHASLEDTADEISALVGHCRPDPDDPACTYVDIGGDADWVARYLAGCALAFEPVDAPELRKELRLIGERLVAAYA